MNKATEKELHRLARQRDKRRVAEQAAWLELRQAIKRAHEEDGIAYSEIGDAVGVTKARVYQIVTGNRGNNKHKGEDLSAGSV